MLSESRKYKLFLTLCHQYVEQLSPELQSAVYGNISHIVSFRVGVLDAPVLAKQLGWPNPETLLNLPNYRAMERSATEKGVPYPVVIIEPMPIPAGGKSSGISWSNSHVTRLKSKVEHEISKFVRRNT